MGHNKLRLLFTSLIWGAGKYVKFGFAFQGFDLLLQGERKMKNIPIYNYSEQINK